MKKILLSACMLALYGSLSANPVNVPTAQSAAGHFLMQKTGAKNIQLSLLSTYGPAQQPALYVFSLNQDKGFIVISAEDAVMPVLAYSTHNAFTSSSAPISPELNYWLNGYTSQIETVVKEGVQPDQETTDKWIQLLSGSSSDDNTASKVTAVSPLLKTTWNQTPYYNKFCPNNAPTGCVATAMAQIMKFWANPTTGTGSHSYSTSTLGGTLSANFSNTTYDWANMPNAIDAHSSQNQINAIATLMFDCGVAVDMDYNMQGSGAQVIDFGSDYPSAEYALRTYFGYSSQIHGEERYYYDDLTWIDMLKNEIDKGQPVLYAGFGPEGGHAFDFDGYDQDSKFHINWGWDGYGDGYYAVNNLVPTFVGVGGGVGNFNDGQQALFGITSGTFKLAINSTFNASSDFILFNTAYAISTEIKSMGNVDFKQGTLLLVAVDTADNTHSIVIDSRKVNIPANTVYQYKFSTDGLPDLPAGCYRLVYKYIKASSTAQVAIADGMANNGTQLLTVGYPGGISPTAKSDEIVFFPNPAKDYINIFWNKGSDEMKDIRMMNIQGQEVFHWESTASGNLKIPVNSYAKGLYFLIFDTSHGLVSKKVVIQK